VAALSDLNGREVITLLPLLILVFWIGLFPNAFLGFMHASVEHLMDQAGAGVDLAGLAQRIAE